MLPINRFKASLYLQISGLLLAWFGGLAAFMFTWGGFGVPVVLVGVALAISGFVMGLIARRTDVQPARTRARAPLRGQTALAFGLALTLYLIATVSWYATSSSGPLNAAPTGSG